MAITGAEREVYTFYDAKQQSAKLSLYVASDGVVADPADDAAFIGIDLGNLSNSSTVTGGGGNTIRAHGPFTTNPQKVTAGSTSNYQDIADKAEFFFADVNGGLHRYLVPAPKSTIFLADQETVDFTQAPVKQFVADMTASTFSGTVNNTVNPVVTRNAVPLSAAVGGLRRRGPTPRKFNIYTRNPTLSGQGE